MFRLIGTFRLGVAAERTNGSEDSRAFAAVCLEGFACEGSPAAPAGMPLQRRPSSPREKGASSPALVTQSLTVQAKDCVVGVLR